LKEEFDPEAENIAMRLLGHTNKENCICIEKKVINTNTAQITALGPFINHRPAFHLDKGIDRLLSSATKPCIKQELIPHIPFRQTTGPISIPSRQAKRSRAIMDCPITNHNQPGHALQEAECF
jgi:hypothetical protein